MPTLLLAACASNNESSSADPTSEPPTPGGAEACAPNAASIQTTVFKSSCDGAGCHGAQNPAAGLDLLSASPETLTGASSALCSGWSLIVPGSPEKSFLYQKLTASKPACGDSMPMGSHVPEASAKCVADWITGMATAGGCETCGGTECVGLASDPAHCGACDNACPTGVPCDNGVCSCSGGGRSCNGVCVDVAADPDNCGGCGKACGTGSSCVGGACSCAGGLSACDASCVDLQSEPLHCGSCGAACAAKEVCLTGKCSAGCGSLTQCGASCVDTQSSQLNCGGCGKACAAGQTCSGGTCGCPGGGQLCGTSCVDTTSDAKNCGACGTVCGAGEACVAGACSCAASGAVSFKNEVAPILSGACTSAGCHAGMKPKENLSLESAKAYVELVNVTAAQCGGQRKLVVPGSPSSSYLMQKMLNVSVCSGTQMPKAGQSLPQKQLDAISSWICSGAPNN